MLSGVVAQRTVGDHVGAEEASKQGMSFDKATRDLTDMLRFYLREPATLDWTY